MDAGDFGTFLGNNVLFIDVDLDDHFNDTLQGSDPCCKLLVQNAGSEDDSASAHQVSSGSLSHASIAAGDEDRSRSRSDDNARSQKRHKADDDDVSALCFEADSPTSFAETAMDLHTPPIADLLTVSYFPSPPTAVAGPSFYSTHSHSGVITPLLPPPPNAEGVALGLPCAADMTPLQNLLPSMPPPQQSTPTAVEYNKSSAVAAGDIASFLNDVLSGKARSPPLGLKLDINSVVQEMNNTSIGNNNNCTSATRFSRRRRNNNNLY